MLVMMLSFASANLVAADVPPQVYDIDIVSYGESLFQQAGTSVSYEVTVKNTGVMGLGDVRLGAERLDAEWFSSDETTTLESGQEANLKYTLNIPEGEEGLHAFSIAVFATSATTGISSTKIVSLEVVSGSGTEADTTTTSTTDAQPTGTTKPTGGSSKPLSDNLTVFVLLVLIVVAYVAFKLFM